MIREKSTFTWLEYEAGRRVGFTGFIFEDDLVYIACLFLFYKKLYFKCLLTKSFRVGNSKPTT
ncbi:MAG: hypothetical protein ABIY50_07665 [Ignavibacteria bacterium]